ncbi:MAG: DUF6514 family protein [Ruminococcus sp.]|nr:DUF6514 family protein [Ruminococcus sp.]
MFYTTNITEMNKIVGDFSLTYYLIKKDEVVEGTICTTFDIEVHKMVDGLVEKEVCSSVSSDIDKATSILDMLYRNDVLPDTLLEVMEECLEIL